MECGRMPKPVPINRHENEDVQAYFNFCVKCLVTILNKLLYFTGIFTVWLVLNLNNSVFLCTRLVETSNLKEASWNDLWIFLKWLTAAILIQDGHHLTIFAGKSNETRFLRDGMSENAETSARQWTALHSRMRMTKFFSVFACDLWFYIGGNFE